MKRSKWAGWAALLSMAVSLAACGGGGGGSEPGRFELSVSVTGSGRVSSQPGGIDCGNGCRASFAEGTTVTLTAAPAAGQQLASWAGACNGTAPTCTLTMSRARAASARFQAAPPLAGWGDLVQLAGAGAVDPLVAIDAAGRATAVWRRLEPGTGEHHLWSSRSAAGDVWSVPERLEANPGNVSELRLAVDRVSGRGMLVWVQAGTTVDLHARALDPARGWGAAALVESGAGMVGVSSVGVDAAGNALAVWSQIGPGPRFSIFANRYVPTSGWGNAGLIENNEVVGGADGDPMVAVMPTGDAVAVWKRSAGNWAELWTNRYANGSSSWTTASQVVADAGTEQFIGRYDLAADARGRALLVWGQLDIAGGIADNAIWFKRFAASGWQTNATRLAPAVANTQGFISTPVLRVNGAGAAVVAWLQSDTSLVAAAAPADGPFSAASTLREAAARPWTAMPVLSIDDAGSAIAAWSDPDSLDLMFSRLLPANGWTPAVANEAYVDPSLGPALAMNEAGNAVLAWPQLFPSSGAELVVRRYLSGR